MLSKGLAYEKIALDFLSSKGLKHVESNFHTRFGEIDLIMKERNTLVFIEVRFRNSGHYGSAAESVNVLKQKKIIKSAKFFLNQNNFWHLCIRFDVIAITPKTTTTKENDICWFKSAFITE